MGSEVGGCTTGHYPAAVLFDFGARTGSENPSPRPGLSLRLSGQLGLEFAIPKVGAYPLVNVYITMENHHFQ